MAETIRDVVIKIRLQQVENRLAPPDLSAFNKAMNDVEKSTQTAFQSVREATRVKAPDSTEFKAATNELALSARSVSDLLKAGLKLERPNTAEFKAAIEVAQNAVKSLHESTRQGQNLRGGDNAAFVEKMRQAELSAKAVAAAVASVGKLDVPNSAEFKSVMNDAEQAANAAASAASRAAAESDPTRIALMNALDDETGLRRRRGRSSQAALGGVRRDSGDSGDSAMADQNGQLKQRLELTGSLVGAVGQLAKGFVFLTASSEDEAAAMLKQLAAAQGYFDLIAGGAATIKGLVALEESLTVARSAGAAAAVKAEASLNGLGPAMSRLGPYGFAAAAGVASVVAVMNMVQEQEQRTRPKLESLADGLQRVGIEGQKFQSGLQATSEINAVYRAQFKDDPQAQADALTKLKQQLDKAYDRAIPTTSYSIQDALQINRVQATYDSERASILQDQLSAQQMITSELKRQQEFAQSQLQTAKETVETEKRRLEARESSFGRLTPGEQSRAVSIANGINNGGKLNEADARFLESVNLGGKQTEAFFRERGQQAGAGTVAKAFGFTQPLEQAEKDLRDANAQFGEALRGLEEEIIESTKKEAQAVDRVVAALRSRFASRSALEELERKIENIDRDQKNGGTSRSSL